MTSNQKQRLFDSWAPVYDSPFPAVFYQAIHQRLMDIVEPSPSPDVLDIGCGTGRLLQRLANQYPGLRGTGLDFSPEMLRQARRTNRHRPRLIFVQGNSAPLRFGNEQFDAVFSTFSFLHYPDPDQVFAEVHRVLRPDGVFYLVDPVINEADQVVSVPISPDGMKIYGRKVREQIGAQAGFRCVEHQYLVWPALLSVFIKASADGDGN